MAIYPRAIYRPLPGKRLIDMAVYNRMNLHVAVADASSLYSAFSSPGVPFSHFYVLRDGSVEQYMDSRYQAAADLEGNDATLSVETQGGVTNANTEPWTPEQIETLANLFAWAVETHDIRQQIATNSQLGPTSQGLSWHRLGIDGNFPPLPSILAGRIQRGGGMYYSTSTGKICPGDVKIQQIPGIFDRATAILTQDSHTTPSELMTMNPFIARKSPVDTYYYVSPAAPKPIAVPIPGGGMTESLRGLDVIEYGASWDQFLKTVTLG